MSERIEEIVFGKDNWASQWNEIESIVSDLPGDGSVIEKVRAMKAERDQFQKLAIFYDAQICAYVETFMEKDDTGEPQYCGKSPIVWLKELRENSAARAAAERGEE